jgi:5-dehydro-4-deoxyglucarate dehydratase
MTTTPIAFDGVLFFPVTPFDDAGQVELSLLREHVSSRLEHSPGGVFPACGTGEFHALTGDEISAVVSTTVEVVGGRVPVISGTGGPLGQAVELARRAEASGADALLVLPPYLVGGPVEGLISYVEQVAAASSLPVIVYHRGTARFTPAAMRRLAANPKVIGFKDGIGDVGLAQEIVLAVAESGRSDFQFFNGAYRGLGIPLYSSAAFAMIPELATAHYRAYVSGDEETRLRLLAEFYVPLVRLRDQVPGFGVSLIKAGIRQRGLPVGSVRAPLVDPNPAQLAELERILAVGDALGAEYAPSLVA